MFKIDPAMVTILNFRLTQNKKQYAKSHPGTFHPELLSNISLVSESKYSSKKFSDCSYANNNIHIEFSAHIVVIKTMTIVLCQRYVLEFYSTITL